MNLKSEIGILETLRRVLEEWEGHQRNTLLRLRRAVPDNDTLPDCGHHGDNSFQEDHFSGIPTTICINVAIFLVLILVFSLLRRNAWNYGRLGYLKDQSLANRENESSAEDMHLLELELSSGNIFSWLQLVFKLSDNEYARKCGTSALNYLNFQRTLMTISGIMTIVALIGPLPANYMGNLLNNATEAYFAKTTIGNLSNENILLWVHVVSGVIMYLAAYFFMKRWTNEILLLEPDRMKNILMIRGMADDADEGIISSYYLTAYGIKPLKLELVNDSSKIVEVSADLATTQETLDQLCLSFEMTNDRPVVRQKCATIDAISYYGSKVQALNEEYLELAAKPAKRVGVAFLSFPMETGVEEKVVADYKFAPYIKPKHVSKYSESNTTRWWVVNYAPFPCDIIWTNLSRKGMVWYVYWIIINIVILLVTLFLTTPTFVVQTLENLNITDPLEQLLEKKSPLVASYIPTLLLWTFSALIPIIVWYAGYLEKHWTTSSTHYNIMQKCYGFLLLMVLIMPSLGLGALSLLLERLFSKEHQNEAVNRFECIFLADNGSFFVNYIIFAAFLSCGLELLRFPEFIQLGLRLAFAKTSTEKENIKRSRTLRYEYGLQLAWMLTIFSVQSAYSLAVPVINIFGFMYLSIKHLVDRYNIYFAYSPSRLSKQVIDRTIEITMMAVRMGLIFLLLFTLLRFDLATGELTNRPIAVVILTILLLFQLIAFAPELAHYSEWFKNISLLKGDKYVLSDSGTDIDTSSYKPKLEHEMPSSPEVEPVEEHVETRK